MNWRWKRRFRNLKKAIPFVLLILIPVIIVCLWIYEKHLNQKIFKRDGQACASSSGQFVCKETDCLCFTK
jgi:hypothetical protein